MDKYDEQSMKFLQQNDTEVGLQRPAEQQNRRYLLSWLLGLLLIISILLNLVRLEEVIKGRHLAIEAGSFPSLAYSPANEALEYMFQPVRTPKPDPFAGYPRAELDKAWADLLSGTRIRLSADELRTANKTSLKLKDGSGYAGYLEVFHQLHCVKRMIQFRNPDYYADVVQTGELSDEHFDHCIDVLRRGIMCRADTSINTFMWYEGKDHPAGFSAAPRMCVAWDKLHSWATSRALPGQKMEVFGPDEVDSVGP